MPIWLEIISTYAVAGKFPADDVFAQFQVHLNQTTFCVEKMVTPIFWSVFEAKLGKLKEKNVLFNLNTKKNLFCGHNLILPVHAVDGSVCNERVNETVRLCERDKPLCVK